MRIRAFRTFIGAILLALAWNADSFVLSTLPDTTEGVAKLIESHNLNSSTKITSDTLDSLIKTHITENKDVDTLVLRDFKKLNMAIKSLGTDAKISENSVSSLFILYSIQNKGNRESPAFIYGANLHNGIKEIASRSKSKTAIDKNALIQSDASEAATNFNLRIADSLAQSLTTEALDTKSSSVKISQLSGDARDEFFKERVDRFSAVKEMLLGSSTVIPSNFDKILEFEALLSKSLAANSQLDPRATIETLKTIVENFSDSSLNKYEKEEEKRVGNEAVLRRIIDMINIKEDINSIEDLRKLAVVGTTLQRPTLLKNENFQDHFSDPDVFQKWLIDFLANNDIKGKSSQELAALLEVSADKHKEDKEKLVINNRSLQPATGDRTHGPQ